MNTLLIISQFLIGVAILYLIFRLIMKFVFKKKLRKLNFGILPKLDRLFHTGTIPIRTIRDMVREFIDKKGIRIGNTRNPNRYPGLPNYRYQVPPPPPPISHTYRRENTRESLVNNIGKITNQYSVKEKTKIHEMIREEFTGSNYQEMNDNLRDKYPKAF